MPVLTLGSSSSSRRRGARRWSTRIFAATLALGFAPCARAVEFNIFPIVGGDSDVGLGAGQVSDVARLGAVPEKYLWKLESGVFVTAKPQNGAPVVPYQDYYLDLTVPELTASQRLRLEIRPSFTNETTLKYYGIGNASPLPPPGVSIEDTEYQRMHPRLSTEARIRLYDRVYLFVGNIYTYSWLTVRPTSLLAQQRAFGPPEVRELLGSFGAHGIDQLEAEIQYDTRDSETVASHGQFHAANVTISPRVGNAAPLRLRAPHADVSFLRHAGARARAVISRGRGPAARRAALLGARALRRHTRDRRREGRPRRPRAALLRQGEGVREPRGSPPDPTLHSQGQAHGARPGGLPRWRQDLDAARAEQPHARRHRPRPQVRNRRRPAAPAGTNLRRARGRRVVARRAPGRRLLCRGQIF